MKNDNRNGIVATVAECDQYAADHRDWLQSLTRDDLQDMRAMAKHLADMSQSSKSGPLAGVVQLTMHALVMEYQRRAELEAGGEA
jgi:hypothetical protein